MKLSKACCVIPAFLGILGALCLRGQTADGAALTIDRCIEIAVAGNPLVLSSAAKYKAALARVSQAREFHQPTLDVDSDLRSRPIGLSGSDESYLGLSQTFDFPGKRLLRGRIASGEADSVLADMEQLKLDLAYQVKEAFYGVLLADEDIKCARRDFELSEDFLKKAELMNKAGDIAEVEVMRARVEHAKTMNALKTAENGRRVATAKLNYLMSRKLYEPLEVRGMLKGPEITLDDAALTERALVSRPEIRNLESARRAESLRKKLAVMSYLPDLDLGLSRHRIIGEKTTWDFTLSMQVPLFFWQPKRGPVAEAEANLNSIEREADHLRDSIHLEVAEAVLNAAAARDQMALYEDRILAQAEEVYDIFLFKFQKGEIGGIELIEARRSLNDSRRSYIDSLFNYRVAVAALERSVGNSL